jgi:hypothetical protein
MVCIAVRSSRWCSKDTVDCLQDHTKAAMPCVADKDTNEPITSANVEFRPDEERVDVDTGLPETEKLDLAIGMQVRKPRRLVGDKD